MKKRLLIFNAVDCIFSSHGFEGLRCCRWVKCVRLEYIKFPLLISKNMGVHEDNFPYRVVLFTFITCVHGIILILLLRLKN